MVARNTCNMVEGFRHDLGRMVPLLLSWYTSDECRNGLKMKTLPYCFLSSNQMIFSTIFIHSTWFGSRTCHLHDAYKLSGRRPHPEIWEIRSENDHKEKRFVNEPFQIYVAWASQGWWLALVLCFAFCVLLFVFCFLCLLLCEWTFPHVCSWGLPRLVAGL